MEETMVRTNIQAGDTIAFTSIALVKFLVAGVRVADGRAVQRIVRAVDERDARARFVDAVGAASIGTVARLAL
jgi:hypothetical protein